MRKIYFLVLGFICSTSLFAQLEKNQFYPGLSLTGGFRNSGIGYGLQPSASLALGKHSMLTLFGRFQQGRQVMNPYFAGGSSSTTERGFGIGYTYYRYFKKGGKFGWYADLSFLMNNLEFRDFKSGNLTSVTTRLEKQLYCTPGLFYRVSPRVMLFANFGSANLLGVYNTQSFGKAFTIGVKINIGSAPKTNTVSRISPLQ